LFVNKITQKKKQLGRFSQNSVEIKGGTVETVTSVVIRITFR